jgi:hypothetical protein
MCRDLQGSAGHADAAGTVLAYPGAPQFNRVQRLFSAGSYDKFAHAVTRINRALTTESYRTGDVEHAGLDDNDMFGTDPRQLEHVPVNQRDQPYFEVLVVESMTEAQERALRKEVRSWRRPDDEFVYELVVVSSGDEALIAARLNVNLQAVVIRRRFSHQSTRDLSTLAEFVDTKISDDLDDHKSPDERAEILATSLNKLRPELDLYVSARISGAGAGAGVQPPDSVVHPQSRYARNPRISAGFRLSRVHGEGHRDVPSRRCAGHQWAPSASDGTPGAGFDPGVECAAPASRRCD